MKGRVVRQRAIVEAINLESSKLRRLGCLWNARRLRSLGLGYNKQQADWDSEPQTCVSHGSYRTGIESAGYQLDGTAMLVIA